MVGNFRNIAAVFVAILLTSVGPAGITSASPKARQDKELETFLAKQDTHWSVILKDIDTPGPNRPSFWKGGNKEGYYSGALMGNAFLVPICTRLKPPTHTGSMSAAAM